MGKIDLPPSFCEKRPACRGRRGFFAPHLSAHKPLPLGQTIPMNCDNAARPKGSGRNTEGGNLLEQEMKLLEAIVKCSEMGQGTLDRLSEINENGVFAGTMRIQRGEYSAIREEAARLLAGMGEDPGQLSAFEKLSTAVGITMNTLTDKSARHMAEMLIQGSTMGIVDLTKAIRDNPGAGENAHQLADRLLRSMQRDVEELKSYL